jgi:archaellum component FlaC
MGLREVKSELNKLEKETLIKHISELYKKFKPVKEYFDFYFNPDESKILEEYREKVREGFLSKTWR